MQDSSENLNMEQASVRKQKLSSVSSVASRTEQCTFSWSFKHFNSYPKPTMTTQSSEGIVVRFSDAWETVDSAYFATGEGGQQDTWRLSLCPCKVVGTEEYVSIYLRKISGAHVSHVQFKIFLLNDCGEHSHMREGDYYFRTIGFFGWDSFILRKELMNEKSCYLTNGTLSVGCEMTIFSDIMIDSGKLVQEYPREEKKYFGTNSIVSVNTVYKDLYESKTCCDVILETEDENFNVHKAILSAYSPVFARMFVHNMKENNTNIVKIIDITSRVLEQMIRFIYYGELNDESPKTLLGLYNCADKYQVTGLFSKCSILLALKIDVPVVCDVIITAHLHNDQTLLVAAKDFIMKSPFVIMATTQWAKLICDYPELAVDVIQHKSVQNEEVGIQEPKFTFNAMAHQADISRVDNRPKASFGLKFPLYSRNLPS